MIAKFKAYFPVINRYILAVNLIDKINVRIPHTKSHGLSPKTINRESRDFSTINFQRPCKHVIIRKKNSMIIECFI
jgi:hypothetical protein